jgi:urease alpha subunit
MVRHGRTGDVRVDPRTHEVTLDDEALAAPPLEEVALSGRYLLG